MRGIIVPPSKLIVTICFPPRGVSYSGGKIIIDCSTSYSMIFYDIILDWRPTPRWPRRWRPRPRPRPRRAWCPCRPWHMPSPLGSQTRPPAFFFTLCCFSRADRSRAIVALFNYEECPFPGATPKQDLTRSKGGAPPELLSSGAPPAGAAARRSLSFRVLRASFRSKLGFQHLIPI